jgi:hypothetical protein
VAAEGEECGACGRRIAAGFRVRGGDIRCWRHVVRHPAVWYRSLGTALIVGTILTAINQGNLILAHGFTQEILLKMALTYCARRTQAQRARHQAASGRARLHKRLAQHRDAQWR